jgi:hypothetical protein
MQKRVRMETARAQLVAAPHQERLAIVMASEALPQTAEHIDTQGLASQVVCFARLRRADASSGAKNLTQSQGFWPLKASTA